MIPGITTKLSESTLASATSISPKTDIVKVTGSTTINTIVPTFGGGFGGFVILIPTDGAITIGTSGNILVGLAAAQNRALMLIFVRSLGKWILENGV
jgi:hypothetical protein